MNARSSHTRKAAFISVYLSPNSFIPVNGSLLKLSIRNSYQLAVLHLQLPPEEQVFT